MFTVRFRLNTTKYDEQQIERRFHAASHIHNVCIKHAITLLNRLKHDTVYQTYLSEYKDLLRKNKLKASDRKRKASLSKSMSDYRIQLGLSEYGLQSYIKICAKQYRKLLSSLQVQKEASRVYAGVEKVLFGNGKQLHYKKFMDITTISGKNNTNGVKLDLSTGHINWIDLHIKCKIPNTSYITQALNNDISYCEIERMMFPNGWHYYVIVYLKGDPPKKLTYLGTGTMGIDPGTSTIAGVSDTKVVLSELAPKVKSYNKRIEKLNCRMDYSRRAMNPKKYNADGTINRHNHDKWIYSNAYRKNLRLMRTLYRKKSDYIKQSHEELCNRLLADSNNFIVENMSYKGLQRRAKKTERQDHTSAIANKDGTVKLLYKYKRKKRFGRSMNNRAPAKFLMILEQKCRQYCGIFTTINTMEFKASQYDHVTDTYTKSPINQRNKQVGGHLIQRDLYSAFLIKNTADNLKHPDRDKCLYEFEHFVTMQNNLINQMKSSGLSMRQCFGF